MPAPTDLLTPDARWTDPMAVLLAFARRDLEASPDDPRLYVVAAEGEVPTMVAISRPWPQGEHHRPVVELGSLALGLGADRLGVAVTARAWSMDDPIPPVTAGADLRQRVLCAHLADGHGRDEAEVSCTLQPFSTDGPGITFGAPQDMGRGEGWLPDALGVVVTGRATLRGEPHQVRQQARRCDELGHVVGLAPRHTDALLAGS